MAGPLRQPIDIPSLTNYITTHVPQIQTPITIAQFGFGQSNPTYLLTSYTGQKSVLRKKPPGKLVSASAHKVEREYRILKALETTSIPVPRTYCLCTDASVLGTPFYIMEFLDGRIFEDASFPGVTVDERKVMWREAMRILARFHALDPRKIRLEGYGRSGGFYARQLETWRGLAHAQGAVVDAENGEPVSDVPGIERMIAFFSDEWYQPRDRVSLIHGDFKIDNLVFQKTEPRIIGILDWEMSTTGHPLADIANVVHPWTVNALSPNAAREIGLPYDAEHTDGLPSVAQCVAWYAEETGWNPAADLRWAEAFCLFRLSIIYQGIAARYAARQATSPKARELGRAMYPCAELAERVIQEIEDKDTDRARL